MKHENNYFIVLIFITGSWLNAATSKSLCDPKRTNSNFVDCSLRVPGQDEDGGISTATAVNKNRSETTETPDEYPEVVIEKINAPTSLQAVYTSVYDLFHWAYSNLL